MPELASEPPQLVARVSSETGCGVRRTSLAAGKSLATSCAARSTVFRIPPASWMLTIVGLRSGWPGAAMRWRSTITAAWFVSHPRPIRM
jgi:hypothetical protein